MACGDIFIIMKKIILLIFLTSSVLSLKSQCFVELGLPQHGCIGYFGYDTINIGSNLMLTSGTPPFTYLWQANYVHKVGSIVTYLYASDLLNDTTLSNPEYITYYDSVVFKLTVTDALGNSCIDSLLVFNSNIQTHLAYLTPSILYGDSVYLDFTPNLFGGIAPLDYLWRPNHGLKDSTKDRGFWAKPDSSIAYYLTVTDSVGCTATAPPLYFVIVNHIGIDENELNNQVKVFPNPTKGIVNITSKDLHIEGMSICNVLGQQVYFSSLFQEQIDISSFPEGLYILTLKTNKGSVRKKMKKE